MFPSRHKHLVLLDPLAAPLDGNIMSCPPIPVLAVDLSWRVLCTAPVPVLVNTAAQLRILYTELKDGIPDVKETILHPSLTLTRRKGAEGLAGWRAGWLGGIGREEYREEGGYSRDRERRRMGVSQKEGEKTKRCLGGNGEQKGMEKHRLEGEKERGMKGGRELGERKIRAF
ncbi:hypothetical protein E2C01_071253 [Portunus trituberculatus]|uniref:Uncharacterized protein n=1 Tax=Portunus trituberculatus TaxID=210409 RepID=A0A5B7HUW2_PORTR|nr:hypothetical protein [Portunus trituberculatus]